MKNDLFFKIPNRFVESKMSNLKDFRVKPIVEPNYSKFLMVVWRTLAHFKIKPNQNF